MKTIVAFEHMGQVYRKGQDVADDDPLITLAPHLFPPADTPDTTQPSGRIRGPLVNPPKVKE